MLALVGALLWWGKGVQPGGESVLEVSATVEAHSPVGSRHQTPTNDKHLHTEDAPMHPRLADCVAPLAAKLGDSGVIILMRRILVVMSIIALPITPLSGVYYLGAEYFSGCTGMHIT